MHLTQRTRRRRGSGEAVSSCLSASIKEAGQLCGDGYHRTLLTTEGPRTQRLHRVSQIRTLPSVSLSSVPAIVLIRSGLRRPAQCDARQMSVIRSPPHGESEPYALAAVAASSRIFAARPASATPKISIGSFVCGSIPQ